RAHGFAEEGGDRSRSRLVEESVQLPQRGLAGRIEPPRRRLEVQMFRQVRGVRLLKRATAAQGERSHRGAVVGLCGGDHPPAVRLTALHVVEPPELPSRIRRPSVVVSQTPSPRSMFGYGRSRKRGNTLVSSDRIAPRTVPSMVAILFSPGPPRTGQRAVRRRAGTTPRGATTS